MMTLFPQYIMWHYGRAYREAFDIWKTFLWFSIHAFRIPLHLRTLFTRFNRLGETYSSTGFDIAEIASNFFVNTLMRLIGALLRSLVIILGVIFWVLVLVGGVVFFVVWTFYPLIIFGLIGFGAFAFFV